jgi:hypothetical protein
MDAVSYKVSPAPYIASEGRFADISAAYPLAAILIGFAPE